VIEHQHHRALRRTRKAYILLSKS